MSHDRTKVRQQPEHSPPTGLLVNLNGSSALDAVDQTNQCQAVKDVCGVQMRHWAVAEIKAAVREKLLYMQRKASRRWLCIPVLQQALFKICSERGVVPSASGAGLARRGGRSGPEWA